MAALIGNIEEFRETSEWSQYVERLDLYFKANEIESEGKKQATLLTVIGPTAYNLLRSLVAPAKPVEKSYAELIKVMQQHQSPVPSEIVERCKFNSRFRKESESVGEFVASLRALAEHCNYGQTLDEMIRDRLVCGIRHDRIQRVLLAEKKLTLNKAIEFAQSVEMAEKNVADLQSAQASHDRGATNKVYHKQKFKGPPQNETNPQYQRLCGRCGSQPHTNGPCPALKFNCHKCGMKGHFAKVCRKKTSQPQNTSGRGNRTQFVDAGTAEPETEEPISQKPETEYFMYKTTSHKEAPMILELDIAENKTRMEIDTGASLTIISEATYNSWENSPKLSHSELELKTYTGEKIPVVGSCEVAVKHHSQNMNLPLLIVAGNGPNLLGRNWLSHLKLNWNAIHVVNQNQSLEGVLAKYDDLFEEGLGKLKGHLVEIAVQEDAQPKFCKARPVPFAQKQRIETELERLERDGVIQPVSFSRWAAPIVPVMKESGAVRICGDYKTTVNRVAETDIYPLPRVEELFTSLSGGKKFSKLDLSHAYLQLELEEQSRELVTINTHKGLFQYTRLPFGVSAAPAIFQRTIEGVLANIPHTVAFLDDILITGKTEKEHLENLEKVLKRLSEAGLRLKREKCVFLAPEVTYLGHRISSAGIHPTEEKVRAVKLAPQPTNVSELKSYLGLINYYGKFMPNLATVLAPLHELLRKNTKWKWGPDQERAFAESKELLMSQHVLVHYDPELPVILNCDASPHGVGVVLAHKMADGTEKPIAYASRSLSPAEKNYAQIDREALAMVFGVRKFHQYLYGRKFEIATDHKPLLGLFGELRAVPMMASSRVQRWALTLSAYNYKLVYKPGAKNGNADALSRLPLKDSVNHTPKPADYVFVMNHMESTPVTPDYIREWTSRDPVLSQVREFVLKGWPSQGSPDIAPYWKRRDELSVHDGCIMWGARVIIPPQGRNRLTEEIHDTHPGICRMKSLARSYFWWPNMDEQLENKVKHCAECQESRKTPPVAPLHPWEWPKKPWSRVHLDYAGPFLGRMFLVLVDAHSKWMDIFPVHRATSTTTIEKLRETFAIHGLPEVIVTDNGTCFTSAEFQQFLAANSIRHVRTAPFHPSSNGLAERAVQSFKAAMKRMKDGSVETKLSRFLMRYRITPHATTGVPPAQLLFNRLPRSRFDGVRPSVESRVHTKQLDQKRRHDQHAKERKFNVGDPVYVKNFAGGPKWLPGTVVKSRGQLHYEVRLSDDRLCNRHIDHVRRREDTFPIPVGEENEEHENVEPLVVRRSNRGKRQPERYGEPIPY